MFQFDTVIYHALMPRTPRSGPGSTAPGTTARTRRAILDAAISVYARDRTASLSEVARAAGVGRSTLHRYFPDRSALVRELARDAVEATRQAFEEAALDQGAPAEAFPRAVQAVFRVSDRMAFLFGEGQGGEWDEAGFERAFEEAHAPVADLLSRGLAEGVLDPEYDPEWFVRALWYMASAGWESVTEGSMPRHRAVEHVTRTLTRGLFRPPSPEGEGRGVHPGI
ncbi:TetR/AcrR family transcriptional regulator [Streptomyces sodiiphilus]|uniref:TetR/AcrR family transcriptional regulator n=1 Tax=Streptomyces sodiiphilus TaxID=226217 RepID=A0ABP5AL04_9ACTN